MPNQQITTSQSGIDLIKNYETLRRDAHDVEGNGKLTIGYGHYNDPNISAGVGCSLIFIRKI